MQDLKIVTIPKKSQYKPKIGDLLFDSKVYCTKPTATDTSWQGKDVLPWINLFAVNGYMNPWDTLLAMDIGGTPDVASVSPGSGPAAGGTPVTITGTNFLSGNINDPSTTVKFGSVQR